MERFVAIADIRLEHDYYNPPVRHHFRLKSTSQSEVLMKQRGVLFIQVAPGEWQWLMEEKSIEFMSGDMLEVSVMVDDPEFMWKITTMGYDPQQLYQISLEKEDVVIDPEFVWTPVPEVIKRKGEFCRIVWKPVQARIGKYAIKFRTPAYCWEYLFVFKDETEVCGKFLMLETSPRNVVVFCSPKKYEEKNRPLGNNVWRIVSDNPVSLLQRYDFTLILYESSIGEYGRKVLSRFIPYPTPGKYVTDCPNILREIYYL